jgi:hypothetical protein
MDRSGKQSGADRREGPHIPRRRGYRGYLLTQLRGAPL